MALLPCFALLCHTSVGFPISSAQLLPPGLSQTLVHCYPLSLCVHRFLGMLNPLTSPGTESEKWDMLCWVGNMTYLPTHSHKLSHVSCRVICSLVDLFQPTHRAFKYTEIIHANLSHAITLACLLLLSLTSYLLPEIQTQHTTRHHSSHLCSFSFFFCTQAS